METSLVVAFLMLLVLAIAICVAWVKGKSAGVEQQQLKDTLEHQEKTRQAMAAQQELDRQMAAKEAEIRGRSTMNLTPENVDKLMKKYRKLN